MLTPLAAFKVNRMKAFYELTECYTTQVKTKQNKAETARQTQSRAGIPSETSSDEVKELKVPEQHGKTFSPETMRRC